jgi:hypothetical protein
LPGKSKGRCRAGGDRETGKRGKGEKEKRGNRGKGKMGQQRNEKHQLVAALSAWKLLLVVIDRRA